jgi:hypothetical protein
MDFQIGPVFGILSGLWLLMFLFSRSQTEQIKRRTLEIILEQAELVTKQSNHPTVEQFYNHLQPIWEDMLKKSAIVILHKSELFPVPANPKTVRKRLNFTPAWLGAYLRLHGFHLKASDELEKEIRTILALAPSRKAGR